MGVRFRDPVLHPRLFICDSEEGVFLGVRFWDPGLDFFFSFWGSNFVEKQAPPSQVSSTKGPVYPSTACNRKGASLGPAAASPCVSHTLLLSNHRYRGSRDSQGTAAASVGVSVQLLLSHFQFRTGSPLLPGSLLARRSASLLCSEKKTHQSFLPGASLHLSLDRRRFAGRPYESLFNE